MVKVKLKPDYPWTKINPLDFRFRGKWYDAIILGLLLLLTSCSQPDLPKGIFTKVERVISGQSLEILDKTGKIPVLQQVRLAGIMAPDLKQDPWGIRAKQHLKQLSEGKKILLEADLTAKDRYGRISGYIWLDGILINEHLLKEGYVLAETTPIYNSGSSNFQTQYGQRFNYAQEYARLMGNGIWNPEQPMGLTPTEFRDQQP